MFTKKTRLVFILWIGISIGYTNTLKVTPTLTDVTLFLNAAELKYDFKAQIKPGNTKILIQNLSTAILFNSLRINYSSDVEIVSMVEINGDELINSINSKKLKIFKDSINWYKQKVNALENELKALEFEKSFLQESITKGEENYIPLTELEKLSGYYRNRIFDLNQSVDKIQANLNPLRSKLDSLQIEELNFKTSNNHMRKSVELTVKSQVAQEVEFSLAYLISKAAWKPMYDIIASETEEKIRFKYNAKILNESGIDWNQVNITLSTLDPFKPKTLPTLSKWDLNQQIKPVYLNTNIQQYAPAPSYDEEIMMGSVDKSRSKKREAINKPVETMNVDVLSIDFKIEQKHSIPSGKEVSYINIKDEMLTTSYEYLAIPLLDKNAYLSAKIHNWETLNILSGNANMYMGKKFIGEAYITPPLIDDTLVLSFGPDLDIVAQREKKKVKEGNVFIGSDKKELYEFEISVKNNKQIPIKLKLLDQVPTSSSSDISISILELSGAKKDDTSGELEWILNLDKKSTKSILLSYSFKYPKSRKVYSTGGRQVNQKTLFAPSF